ncbi:MAG: hypothetical protein EAZ65_06005 [Verrucomicrobia bacterium]|nr:MAG: hypothetical protein EAZ84_06805 [Verrucomicrobiota bacterium]TAE87723.1 MAG: hypothetical protein EAZ82_07130 [Verrucomicrobiota bacterium]TAF25344.1 MAG: hypothetical protein EAZ71_07615 [Verrucomicrobiota bacterium]TAF41130.1 MAG: hypothetical protein EAZ65_06005 [Verrucomicrobiota bacterium]
MRLVLLSFLALLSFASADHVILTGGPALRKWEDLRIPRDQHDRWWANFIRASTLRMAEIRQAYGENSPIVWIVYRSGYQDRGIEDSKPYTTWISDLARKRNASLIWVESTTDIIDALNHRPRGSVQSFDYFGHSNRHCFLLDYSGPIMAASTVWLHERDLGKIRSSIFAKNAYCKSWGCHTGQSMSKTWKKHTGVKLEGARGKTDYTLVGHGQLPIGVGWVR